MGLCINIENDGFGVVWDGEYDLIKDFNQINDKHYSDTPVDYIGEVVVACINYDRRTKRHRCIIDNG